MLKEALHLIQETAQKAQLAQRLDIPDERVRYFQLGGVIEQADVPPPVRDHHLETLGELIEYAKANGGTARVVWHSDTKVVLILDDADRRDRATFILTPSQQFKILAKLEQHRTAMTQAELIRLLRIDLGHDDRVVIDQFRKLQWKSAGEVRVDVQRSKESLGRDIMAVVQGVDELPEEITIRAPLYANQGERSPALVRCLVEIDATNQRIQLIPAADELTTALQSHQADLRARLDAGLAESAVRIYQGSP